ncbi:MAG: hypothetical protein OWU32_04550 [Firmicutes bacterium]|nr:hypothetical protein [Bacillota bacterium]
MLNEGGIVFGCIVPHGLEVVPDIAGPERDRFAAVSAGVADVSRRLAEAAPDLIVLATPHGFRCDGKITVMTNSLVHGRLEKWGLSADVDGHCDRDFALALVAEGIDQNLPITGAFFGSSQGEWSVLPLDWGAFVPLWFFLRDAVPRPDVVVLTPTRDAGLEPLVALGRTIARLARKRGRRVAFVASADQGHAHDEHGPYGFHEASGAYDKTVCQAIEEQDIARLLTLDPAFVDAAKPDSLWQIAILRGVQEEVPLRGELHAYHVPTYYGMLSASFIPTR